MASGLGGTGAVRQAYKQQLDVVDVRIVRRNVTVLGRRISVRLEPAMWRALREIAWREECRIHDLCSLIAWRKHPDTTLTAAIRVFLMHYYRAAATEEGHGRAGHGSFSRLMRRAGVTQDMRAT